MLRAFGCGGVVHIGKTGLANTLNSSSHIGVGIGIGIGIEYDVFCSEPDPDSDPDPECCATAAKARPRMFFRSVPPPAGAGLSIEKNESCRLVIVAEGPEHVEGS